MALLDLTPLDDVPAALCGVCDARPATRGSRCEACYRYRSRHGCDRGAAVLADVMETKQEPLTSAAQAAADATTVGHGAFLGYLMHGEAVDGPVGLEELEHRPAWMAEGACRGAGRRAFFPERGEDVRPAKALCAGCAVRIECFEYAMADAELVGIWGGTSVRERRRLRTQRLRDAFGPCPRSAASTPGATV